MSIREGIQAYYGSLGIRGLLAISSYRMFGVPEEVSVQPPGIRHPLRLRLGTSDASTYENVVQRQEYGIELPFVPEVILDAGANVGLASIYFANRYPKARIIAVEAEIANFAALVRNVQPYPAVVPIHAALWNRDGMISVDKPEPEAREWAFVTGEGSGRPVRAITIQTLMREMSISSIDLAKIDIEGAERQVFADPVWLPNVRCLMVELHDSWIPGCSAVVEPAMRGFVRADRSETALFLRPEDASPGASGSRSGAVDDRARERVVVSAASP
jgi:FkbM family methyltransferase